MDDNEIWLMVWGVALLFDSGFESDIESIWRLACLRANNAKDSSALGSWRLCTIELDDISKFALL